MDIEKYKSEKVGLGLNNKTVNNQLAMLSKFFKVAEEWGVLEKIPKILVFKTLTSSLAVTMILYGASEYLLNKLTYRPFTALCYVMGIVSFEVVVRYSNVRDLGHLIEEFYRMKLNKKDKG